MIPFLPKPTNQLSRMHWAAKSKMVNEIKVLVRTLVGHRKPPQPLERATLTLTRFSSTQPDYDGLVSSFKHVIDGLIWAQVLENDKWDNIGAPTYKWNKAPRKKGFIEVVVESEDGNT